MLWSFFFQTGIRLASEAIRLVTNQMESGNLSRQNFYRSNLERLNPERGAVERMARWWFGNHKHCSANVMLENEMS